jgi:hypothetical protein
MAHVLFIDDGALTGHCECGCWRMVMPDGYYLWRAQIETEHRFHVRNTLGLPTRTTELNRFIREIEVKEVKERTDYEND